MPTPEQLRRAVWQAIGVLSTGWVIVIVAEWLRRVDSITIVAECIIRIVIWGIASVWAVYFARKLSATRPVMIAILIYFASKMVDFVIRLTVELDTFYGMPLFGDDHPSTKIFQRILLAWGTLAAAFLFLAAVTALKKTNDRLEERVRERTMGLENANKRLELEIRERVEAEHLLRIANETLEQRAALRTEELSVVNERLRSEIRERERIATALLDSEEKLRAVLECVPTIIATIDRQGTILYINRTIPAFSIERVLGTRLHEYLDGELAPDVDRVMQKVFDERKPHQAQIQAPVGNGELGWYDCRLAPMSPNTNPPRAVLVATDISQIKDAEEHLRMQREQLAHVSRVSTMGEMAATLAHELNQPLSAITNYAYLASDLLKRPENGTDHRTEAGEILDRLMHGALRAGEIVQRIRSFLSNKTSIRSPARLNACIREVIEMLEPEIREAEVIFILNLDDNVPSTSFDVVQIQQVLVNLLRNAFDTSLIVAPELRHVTVSTRLERDRCIEATIRDSGPGLPPHRDIEQLFESFYTTKPNGMGMGLKISRSIIEAHGGSLWGRSNPDRGSTFGFTLPLPAAAERAVHEQSADHLYR